MGARKYHFTPEMDEEIRQLYYNEAWFYSHMHEGPVTRLAKQWKIPTWRISKRANELGVRPFFAAKSHRPWNETELWILKQSAHRCADTIQRYLKRAGYHRSIQGIRLKMWYLKLSKTANGYNVNSLAEFFGVDNGRIMGWIRKGLLKAQPRGTRRKRDEWFIRPEWVREFVIKYVANIDFRKLNKYWFVELFAKALRDLGWKPAGVTADDQPLFDQLHFKDVDAEWDNEPPPSDLLDELETGGAYE